jgi:hypothetical protein
MIAVVVFEENLAIRIFRTRMRMVSANEARARRTRSGTARRVGSRKDLASVGVEEGRLRNSLSHVNDFFARPHAECT